MLVSVSPTRRNRCSEGHRCRCITWQFLWKLSLYGFGGVTRSPFGRVPELIRFGALVRCDLTGCRSGFCRIRAVGPSFGTWPAVKAARLDPIVALRHNLIAPRSDTHSEKLPLEFLRFAVSRGGATVCLYGREGVSETKMTVDFESELASSSGFFSALLSRCRRQPTDETRCM